MTIDHNEYDKEDILNLLNLQRVIYIETDVLYPLKDCAEFWMNYSQSLAANWMRFPVFPQLLFMCVKPFIKP